MQFELRDATNRVIDFINEFSSDDFSKQMLNVTDPEAELLAAKVIVEYALDSNGVTGWELEEWLKESRAEGNSEEDPLDAAVGMLRKVVQKDGKDFCLTDKEVDYLAATFIQEAVDYAFWEPQDFQTAVEQMRADEPGEHTIARAKSAIASARGACKTEAEVFELLNALQQEIDDTRQFKQMPPRGELAVAIFGADTQHSADYFRRTAIRMMDVQKSEVVQTTQGVSDEED
ncbi:MAG: hypothetical protein LH702_05110 [Phormidesmis sp. CAN_BIN44]|nr:hypothetical protein [Phormidesmis sp. CAN_BIN44]